MYRVELYARVRRACQVEGMGIREAARVFGVDRRTVAKMQRTMDLVAVMAYMQSGWRFISGCGRA